MPRGGRRPGAGRPKGASSKASGKAIAAILTKGIAPIDVYERVMPVLLASKDEQVLLAALDRAAKFRKLFHSEFAPTDAPARPHESQGLPLFDAPHKPPPQGKKEAAVEAANAAAQGPGWGDLLKTSVN